MKLSHISLPLNLRSVLIISMENQWYYENMKNRRIFKRWKNRAKRNNQEFSVYNINNFVNQAFSLQFSFINVESNLTLPSIRNYGISVFKKTKASKQKYLVFYTINV